MNLTKRNQGSLLKIQLLHVDTVCALLEKINKLSKRDYSHLPNILQA